MRHSTAVLGETNVRLTDLTFPASRVHVQRTRLAYIHLDNLLHFAKIDRDGRVDGYITAYLPDEVALLFLKRGEVATAVAFTERGRQVLPIATVLKRMQDEMERGELAYHEAPPEQLAWMYRSCAGPRLPRQVAGTEPQRLFQGLQEERYSGVVELISNGRVTYFRFEDGAYKTGFFCDRDEQTPVTQFVEGLFASQNGTPPELTAAVFDLPRALPEQASPALIHTYRELFARITEAAEREVSDEAPTRARKLRDRLSGDHVPLLAIGTPLDQEPDPLVVSPEELTEALATWAESFLEQLEVIAPGVAPTVLATATREHRFVLQKAGFYERLPWTPTW